ncbi:MAG TPA: hypothetical protein DC054_10650 [Blastocatellia bacterium]|nr:hypothetical protein [Blastocatellia bacterium]
MNDYAQNHPDPGCSSADDRADQPPSDETKCPDLPPNDPPDPYKPEDCNKTPACNCPDPPGATEHCLEDLIDQQTAQVTVADKAKTFKAELEALLAKAKAASQEYTAEKYGKLVKQWEDEDAEIAELIRKLVCAVPCWRCILECYVCPLIDDMRKAELQLSGDGKLCRDMHSIYDLRYWHERNTWSKDRIFQRIKAVLAVWEKPAQTIEKILTDNAKLIVDCSKAIGSDPSNAVYDVFLKLVPMHLAIAPPATDKKTKIAKKFTVFCECDTGNPEACCGPDVGELTLRERLIGTQPYLIKPDHYFKLICCLVDKLYRPAKDLLAEATAALEKVENEIKRYQAQIENGLKDFEKNAKARIPSPIECCGDKLPKPEQPPNQTAS